MIPRKLRGALVGLVVLGFAVVGLRLRQVRPPESLPTERGTVRPKPADAEAARPNDVRSAGDPTPAPTRRADPVPVETADGDTTVVHGPGTVLTLTNGMVVSSPQGGMVSDAANTLVTGNLVVQQDGMILQADDVLVDAQSRKVTARSHVVIRSARTIQPSSGDSVEAAPQPARRDSGD